MKSNYSIKSISFYIFSLCLLVLASSCTIYQNVPDDDGIYTTKKKGTRVIVANSDEHQEYENNYFTKELERLDLINGTDILTDIERYSSLNDSIPTQADSISNYNTNNAWGYNDYDDVVVNININSGFGWGNNWNLYDPYFQYSFFNPWLGSNWGYGWGNRWSPGFYWAGFRRFNNPFFNPFGPYHPFYHGLAGYRSARWRYLNNGFYGYNNYNYGRRNGYASATNRRNSNASRSRATFTSNSRRNSRVASSSTNNRRRTSSTRNRNSSRRVINRNSRSTRSTINRSSNSRTNRSSTSRSSSTRSSSSRGSSGRSGGSSRGGSSRRGG